MTFSITLIIVLVTSVISIISFQNENMKNKWMFSPYKYTKEKNRFIILSHGFVHADFLHLFFNMYVLYVFGSSVEDYFQESSSIGYIYYISFYILGLIFSTFPSILKNHNNPSYYSLGASGAVSAVVFSNILLFPLDKLGLILLPGLYLPGFVFGFLYLLSEHYLSKKQYSNIAHDAHISGAVFGILFLILYDFEIIIQFFQEINSYLVSF